MYLSEQLSLAAPRQRRAHPRVQVQCRARITIAGRHYAGYLDNISRTGARLRTITSIRKIGVVVLRLPDMGPFNCDLRWTDAYNAGVMFKRPLSADQLREWVSGRSMSAVHSPSAMAELIELVE